MFDHDFEQFPELTNAQLESLELLSPHIQITADFDAVVVKVVDGDTVRLTTSFRDFDFPLRLLDIDTKELNEGGEDAKKWLREKLTGSEVRVMIDSQNRVGRYGRLLGRIFFNGLDVGQEMLYLGYAVPFGSRKESLVRDIDYYVQGVFA